MIGVASTPHRAALGMMLEVPNLGVERWSSYGQRRRDEDEYEYR
jgi:hypothetical protein